MVDNAAHSVVQLEETVQKRDATIARQSAALLRLLDENHEDRASRQDTPTGGTPRKSTKIPDPPNLRGQGCSCLALRDEEQAGDQRQPLSN